MGGSRWHVFRTVLLPVSDARGAGRRAVVFIETPENSAFPPYWRKTAFLAVDIFKLFAGEADNNPAAAGALSVLLIVCTALVCWRSATICRNGASRPTRAAPAGAAPSRGWRAVATLYSWGIVLLSLMPFVAVLGISFLRFRGPVPTWDLGLSNYAGLLAGSYEPLYNTLILATVAALVATVVAPIGYIVTRHRGRLSPRWI